jgi:hypothetical protein
MSSIISRAAINNAILDPFQGFDIDVFVQDQATGVQVLAGSFTSFQFTMRNATEPYLELNQRVPRLLDGVFQFGWVLERGCLDVRFVEQTFGFRSIGRELRVNRSPRFQITLEMNAPELDGNPIDGSVAYFKAGASGQAAAGETRMAKGRIRLVYAKTDALTFGAMAGGSVVANRWEGLCEGIYRSDEVSGWAGIQTGQTDIDQDVSLAQSRDQIERNNVNGSGGIIRATSDFENTYPSWLNNYLPTGASETTTVDI